MLVCKHLKLFKMLLGFGVLHGDVGDQQDLVLLEQLVNCGGGSLLGLNAIVFDWDVEALSILMLGEFLRKLGIPVVLALDGLFWTLARTCRFRLSSSLLGSLSAALWLRRVVMVL